jgi:hypothetical protein
VGDSRHFLMRYTVLMLQHTLSRLATLLFCASCLSPLKADTISLEGLQVQVSFPGFASPKSTATIGAGVEFQNYQGLFDIDFQADRILLNLLSDWSPTEFAGLQFYLDSTHYNWIFAFEVLPGNTLNFLQFGKGTYVAVLHIGFNPVYGPWAAGSSATILAAGSDVPPPPEPVTPVPEPSTLALAALGALGLVAKGSKTQARSTTSNRSA